MQAAEQVKMYGERNNLLDLVRGDQSFGLSEAEIDALVDPEKFTGCAGIQTQDFIDTQVQPMLGQYAGQLGLSGDVEV